MKSPYRVMPVVSSFAFCLALSSFAEAKLNPQRIQDLTGQNGSMDSKKKVFKVTYPRKDLKVEATGVKVTPALGLTAWAAFQEFGKHTMVMGDMVVTEGQVDAVMDAALESGLEVTALHNHFLWEKPRVMFMHVGGMGGQEKLASAVGKVFAKIKETEGKLKPARTADIEPKNTQLDTKKLEQTLGHSGKLKDAVYKVTISKKTKMHGHTVGKAMGVNTWAAFAGTDKKAVVGGDFAMLAHEVQPILKALRKAGISVVALHNHMIGDQPQIFFLHYWGIDSAENLATGLRAALDAQKAASSRSKEQK